ncbi:EAL domain-containing protein, partial [Vibrio parahaemolyticus]
LSPRQFESAGLVEAVGNVFAETAIDPGAIEFEVTETVLAADTARAIEVLRDLRGLGATIAIDDFGTGYSSLSYLSQFPVNTLKIDQVFLRGIPGNTSDESIIDAILNLAQGLRLTVV